MLEAAHGHAIIGGEAVNDARMIPPPTYTLLFTLHRLIENRENG